jgi:hypothetical protein
MKGWLTTEDRDAIEAAMKEAAPGVAVRVTGSHMQLHYQAGPLTLNVTRMDITDAASLRANIKGLLAVLLAAHGTLPPKVPTTNEEARALADDVGLRFTGRNNGLMIFRTDGIGSPVVEYCVSIDASVEEARAILAGLRAAGSRG